MGKFRESQTAKNLLVSFAAETQANARYTFFANKAQDDGFMQIAGFFKETADQELEHALRFFKFFNEGDLELNYDFPTGAIKNTYDNLISSAAIEYNVHTKMYPDFAKTARDENYIRAAETWDAITVAEKQHEKSFLALAENIKFGRVLKRKKKVVWRCTSCGYIHEGNETPEQCPACVKPAGYFELLSENW
ncbi:MAG: rubrerythrin family protein [Desulfobacterales bacterium]|nr:rubrerythrin family protein [Desulfobacterales bacterium]